MDVKVKLTAVPKNERFFLVCQPLPVQLIRANDLMRKLRCEKSRPEPDPDPHYFSGFRKNMLGTTEERKECILINKLIHFFICIEHLIHFHEFRILGF